MAKGRSKIPVYAIQCCLKCKTIVVLLFCTGFLYIFYTSITKKSGRHLFAGNLKSSSQDKMQPSTISILTWLPDNRINRFFKNKTFEQCNLPAGKTCQIVNKRGLYNQSEAVVFHLKSLLSLSQYPTYRVPFQKWVVIEEESPPESTDKYWPPDDVMNIIKGWFNITSTYHSHSMLQLENFIPNTTFDEGKWQELRAKKVNHSATRTGEVAWFVSHCLSQARRLEYVHELQKYINVDIYGHCGTMKLSCGDQMHPDSCDMEVLDPIYKFYLSFENSLCEDYVTEKMTRFLYQPIRTIPVVMGKVNYSHFMPEGTYIDALNFSTPKLLADYLRHVSATPELFNSYIDKRLSLIFHPVHTYQSPYHCRLCQFLHEHHNDIIRVDDITKEWDQKTLCTPPWEIINEPFWRRVTYEPKRTSFYIVNGHYAQKP